MTAAPSQKSGSSRLQRLRRWMPAALFAAMAVVYVATISPAPSPDVTSAEFAAWHIARTGDPVPEIADFPELDRNIIRETWIVTTADGDEAIGRAPGAIAAVVPGYWLAQPTSLTFAPGGVVAALLTALTVTLLFVTLRPRMGERRSLLAAAIFGLATPVWTVAADGIWPHTLTIFGVMLAAWAADRERWWLVGLAGGVMLWGRLHAALICAVLATGVAVVRRQRGAAIKAGLASGAMLMLMSVWTHWMYGSWDPSSAYRTGEFVGNVVLNAINPVNMLGFWISPDRGLLVWSPLLVLLLPALIRGWSDLPDWCRYLAAGGAAYFLSQALLNRFSGGDHFYAYRTSLELVACVAPALALTAHEMGERARRWFAPVAVLQLALIAPGAVIDDLHVKVADVWLRNAFVVGVLERPTEVVPIAAGALVIGGALGWAHHQSRGRGMPAAATTNRSA